MRRLLGEVLLEWGAVSEEDLQSALAEQASARGKARLGRILLMRGQIDELNLAAALAVVHNLRWIDLDQTQVDPMVARSLPQGVATRFQMLPIARQDRAITVAVADPVDVVALDELKARLQGDQIDIVIAPATQILARLEFVWGDQLQQDAVTRLMKDRPEAEDEDAESDADSDAGAIAVVHHLLAAGARSRASDIHIEPLSDRVRVRVRVDGTLRNLMELPAESLQPILARLKIISELNVMERRLPQDGRARLRIEGLQRDIRVSTMPTIHGEKMVMRLLPTQSGLPNLADLGLTPEQRERLVISVSQQQGMVLVTGPTGAGKSATLYATISETIDDERNVVTLEDPVEVELAGITQMQVIESIGLTFEAGLRATLRQDPDVVMVGEIRDLQTAQLAVRAGLTGHLVIATLHTLDAPSAIVRLLEMGIPIYLVATSLSLVIAQRLVRRPCRLCAKQEPPDSDTAERLGITPEQGSTMVVGVGCPSCDNTGYRGRIGVFEMLHVTPAVRDVLLAGTSDPAEIRRAGRPGGYQPLLERGVEMAAAGETTAAELLRVLT